MAERIFTRHDLKEWLYRDGVYYPSQRLPFFKRLKNLLISHPCMDQTMVWRYVKNLRKAEYHLNNHGLRHIIGRIWHLYMLRKLGYKTGFQIPPNVVGPGLNLPHYGDIIINDNCKIGQDVTLYAGTCIGWKKRGLACPVIGDNVFIGVGACIIGDVRIGDNVVIGQNCVIVNDIEDNSTVVVSAQRRIK